MIGNLTLNNLHFFPQTLRTLLSLSLTVFAKKSFPLLVLKLQMIFFFLSLFPSTCLGFGSIAVKMKLCYAENVFLSSMEKYATANIFHSVYLVRNTFAWKLGKLSWWFSSSFSYVIGCVYVCEYVQLETI